MIEARFDDLTGASPSFALTEPVGVVEAMRTDEVLPARAAAEAGAARGLWVAGFVAYEAAPGFDPSLAVRRRADGDPFARLPLAWFAMFERREDSSLPEPRDGATDAPEAWKPSIERAVYAEAISRIRRNIAAGETYQINYTLRLRSQIQGNERGLYRDLCFAQRGGHAAYLNIGRYRICSASPELFFQLDGTTITTKPMKGTAPRGRWPAEDDEQARCLVSSEKERAENAMIVDLLRSDLGRIARTGSVRWSEVFAAERYETIWQLTSTVSAELGEGIGAPEVFAALFPSGSITGAPKVRSMEIIADLEDAPRGVYCGAVGYLAPPGAAGPRASFNVAIRTVLVDGETRAAEYGVGGGITWDSSAGAEYEETVAKARVLTQRRPPFDLLETMRRDPGRPIHELGEHLERLSGSADYFGYRLDLEALRKGLAEAGAGAERPVRVRVRLPRDGRFEIAATHMDEGDGSPVLVEIDDDPVDPADPMLFHKTSLRGRYEAAAARHPDAGDVILVNSRGEVTESTIANLAARIDGTWCTPPLDCGLLPGTGRAALIASRTFQERVITVAELRGAGAIELISSTRGRRPAELR
ncbi:MAG: aminodeoxychorismate synthase component I [Actinomycetota bacterium]